MAKSQNEQSIAPDVVDLLKSQHAEIKRGFVAAMLPGPGRLRRFDELRRLLAVHEAAEEAHVHPVARKLSKNGRELARRRLSEEAAAKKLLKELTHAGPEGRGYLRKLIVLQIAVLRHARHEEAEEFPLLRTRVSPLRRRMLGAESLVTQMVVPTRPRPLVNRQLANKLSAPLAGPLDRGRDLMRAALHH